MSWSISVPAASREAFPAAVKDAIERWTEQNPTQVTDEAIEQIGASGAAAEAIVASGCVGDGWVSASLSGHANPGHEKQEGWAFDATGVYVNRAAEPVPA